MIRNIETNINYEREKEIRALYHQMETGEITEDEMKEALEKVNIDIKAMEDGIFDDYKNGDIVGRSIYEKKDDESYKRFFKNNKKEFRNILGL